MRQMTVRISYDAQPEDSIELLEKVCAFLGVELKCITEDEEATTLEFKVIQDHDEFAPRSRKVRDLDDILSNKS